MIIAQHKFLQNIQIPRGIIIALISLFISFIITATLFAIYFLVLANKLAIAKEYYPILLAFTPYFGYFITLASNSIFSYLLTKKYAIVSPLNILVIVFSAWIFYLLFNMLLLKQKPFTLTINILFGMLQIIFVSISSILGNKAGLKRQKTKEHIYTEYKISNREKELIPLITKGLKNNEIAAQLFITEGTVKNHIKSIFQKFAVSNRLQLIYKINKTIS
ncbi:LuxR C-terminal-related transcriptional regulator [Candidatus Margulisiibacteriota bacterium]